MRYGLENCPPRVDMLCIGMVYFGYSLVSLGGHGVGQGVWSTCILPKAYDCIDWTFITDMLTCLGFDQHCVGMINIFFTCASSFVAVNSILSPRIHLHRFIGQGCPLAPYLYVLMDNALEYLLEETRLHGWIKGIYLPRGGYD